MKTKKILLFWKAVIAVAVLCWVPAATGTIVLLDTGLTTETFTTSGTTDGISLRYDGVEDFTINGVQYNSLPSGSSVLGFQIGNVVSEFNPNFVTGTVTSFAIDEDPNYLVQTGDLVGVLAILANSNQVNVLFTGNINPGFTGVETTGTLDGQFIPILPFGDNDFIGRSGRGQDDYGSFVLTTSVPEPSSTLLCALGVGLGLVSRRRS